VIEGRDFAVPTTKRAPLDLKGFIGRANWTRGPRARGKREHANETENASRSRTTSVNERFARSGEVETL
jgi:hypothetical protein